MCAEDMTADQIIDIPRFCKYAGHFAIIINMNKVKMMKTIIINGSPRKNGNCTKVAELFAAALEKEGIETETLQIGSMDISGCRGCWACAKTGRCVQEDAPFHEAAEKIYEAEGLFIAAPVYYDSMPGQLKSFLDRLFFQDRGGGGLRRKVGAATRLAKVTGVKASKTSCEITLKWKKVKKAKKYQIYQYKKSKKKYVRVKTVTRPKTTIKKLKQCKTHKFKIRAIRGSKKGKWSRIISVKTRKPVVHKTAPTNPTDATINLGDTYYVKMGPETLKVKVTSEMVEPDTYGFKGKTSDGGTYEHIRIKGYYMKEYCAHGYKTHFDYEENGDYAKIEDIEMRPPLAYL